MLFAGRTTVGRDMRRASSRTGSVLALVAFTLLGCGTTVVGGGDDVFDAGETACGEGSVPVGAPIDLLALARVSASGVYAPSGVPWPREGRDAVATIRDAHVDTGWWVPVGEPSWLEIDLVPRFGGPVPLLTFTVALDGAAPSGVVVELAPSCGASVTETFAWNDLAMSLALEGVAAGCVRLAWTAGAEVRLTEAGLTGQPECFPECAVSGPGGVPLHATSGVVEGFYGEPWSWRERRLLLGALRDQALGTYVYAPKLDPLHRAEWRTSYPEADLREFAALAAEARRLGVAFLFGISPLIDFDAATDADYQALLAKVRPLVEGGAAGVCLLADDIELETSVDVGAELGSQHAALANRLLADLRALRPDAALWFVPTVYSDARRDGWAGGVAYLEALRALDDSIPVLWTGTDTFAATLGEADLAAATASLGRKPLIWDNFWANDGGDGFFGRLLLGPYSGRSADLPGGVTGIVQNPLIQGAAARLVLSTFASWRADPAAYDPDRARDEAAAREAWLGCGSGPSWLRDKGTVALAMNVFDASTLDTPRYAALADAVAALTGALGDEGVPLAPARELLALLVRLVGLPSELHHSGLDADLVDDLAAPVDKGVREAELGERLAGGAGADALALAKAAALASKTCRFQQQPRLEEALLNPVAKVAAAERGFFAPAAGDSFPACRSGASLEWRPFPGADVAAVGGLPGAVVVGDLVRWTPPHAGRYRVAAAGVGPSGWASVVSPVVCE